jgi:hypothetical protein
MATPRNRAWLFSLLEVVGMMAAVGSIIAVQLWVTGTWSLLSRPFWLDEIYTYTLVADPDPGHAMRALAGGVETHPPTFYLLLRGFSALTGGPTERTLRLFNLVAVLAAFICLHSWLRVRYSLEVTAATILLVWSHYSLINQVFNARCYAAWLAATACFAYLLWRAANGAGVWNWLLLALAAALASTLHYFGIISLALITAAELWRRRRQHLPLAAGMTAVALGALATVACAPFLMSQRAAISVPTWLPMPSWRTAYAFLKMVYHLHIVVPLALTALIASAVRATRLGWLAGRGLLTKGPVGQQALLGLLAMPLLLLAFSYASQNVLIDRYCFPAIVGLVPLAAFFFSRLSRFWLVAAATVIIVITSFELENLAWYWNKWANGLDGLRVAIVRTTDHEDVLFESPAYLYSLCHYADDLQSRCHLLDFEQGRIGRVTLDRLWTRDLARCYAEFYPIPSLMKWANVQERPHLFLVHQNFFGKPLPNSSDIPYPGFMAEQIDGELFLLSAVRSAP